MQTRTLGTLETSALFRDKLIIATEFGGFLPAQHVGTS